MAQIAHLAHQAAQEAPIEARVGVLQDQRRLAEPGDDASRQYVGSPSQRVPGALHRDPFVDQRAGIGAGDAGVRGAQMAQPAEAEQGGRPILGRRLHLEDRTAVADHDFAGEGEAAGIDFAGAGGVGRAQVLRRDQQPVGLERQADGPAQKRVAVDAAGEPPHGAAHEEPATASRGSRRKRATSARSPLSSNIHLRADATASRGGDHNETMTERPTAA